MAYKDHAHKVAIGPTKIFKDLIERGLIDAQDGADAELYLSEMSALRKWKPVTLARQYHCISPFLQQVKTTAGSLEKLNREQAVGLITHLQNHPTWTEASLRTNWDRFITFMRWVWRRRGQNWSKEAYEILGGDLKYRHKTDENKITAKDVFTPAEILELVAAESILGFKALWIVGFEGGLRIGEAMALRIRDVDKTSEGTYILRLPQSKTIKRTIPLELYSPSHLAKWLSLHPQKNNADAPLFVNTLGDPIDYAQANKRLRTIVKTAQMGGKTKVSFHSLRHSRASELASIMTEQQMCVFFGWVIGSRVVRSYVRRGAIDIRQALRRGYGIEKAEEVREQGRKCLHCQNLNSYTAEYCDNCSLPLDAQRLAKIQHNVHQEKLLKEYVKNEFKEQFAQLVKEFSIQAPQNNEASERTTQ